MTAPAEQTTRAADVDALVDEAARLQYARLRADFPGLPGWGHREMEFHLGVYNSVRPIVELVVERLGVSDAG